MCIFVAVYETGLKVYYVNTAKSIRFYSNIITDSNVYIYCVQWHFVYFFKQFSQRRSSKKINFFKERSMTNFRLSSIKHDNVGFYGVLLYTCNKEFILFRQILGQRTNWYALLKLITHVHVPSVSNRRNDPFFLFIGVFCCVKDENTWMSSNFHQLNDLYYVLLTRLQFSYE